MSIHSLNGSRWLAVATLALAFLWAGCTQQPQPAAVPTTTASSVPTVPYQSSSDGAVRASGVVAPARKAQLGFPAAGRVQSVAVKVGDPVQADAVLISLDSSAATAAVAQAQAGLLRAQANLADLKAGARPQEITAAQAKLEAAQAQAAQLKEGARPDEVTAARAELAAAQAALQQLYSGPRPADRIAAESALANAKATLQVAQAAYDAVSWRSDVGMLPESQRLQEATNNFNAAQARYDALFADPDPDVVAAAQARVQQAQANLDRLLTPATESQIAEAEARVQSAQAELDLLTAGARDEAVAAAQAAVAEAEAALQRARADQAALVLHAPFAGTVTTLTVNPGELVLPGQAVLTLADLDHLQVETTDLSERDVARVAVGQTATIFVESLDEEIGGQVARIASEASTIGGDVVYTVVIDLDQQPPGLRWGMTVDVEIAAQ